MGQLRFYALARRVWLVPVLLTLATSASAVDHLKLKSGKTLVGAATSYDYDRETVTFVTTAGETLEIAAKDLDRLSAYKLAKTKATAGNATDEMMLGNIARDVELYVYANRHYGKALDLDPALQPRIDEARERLRREAAEYCMRQVDEAKAKGDSAGVEKWLTTLVEKLPNTPQAEQATEMLGATYAKNHAARDDALEAAHGDLLTTDLAAGKKHYDTMLESIQKGLTNTRSSSKAKREFERAWSEGEKALAELDKVQKKLQDEMPEVPAVFDGYRGLVKDHMVASQLHLASLLTVQSSYKQAQQAVGRALSLDPKNRDALAARARIEIASSRGLGINI